MIYLHKYYIYINSNIIFITHVLFKFLYARTSAKKRFINNNLKRKLYSKHYPLKEKR